MNLPCLVLAAISRLTCEGVGRTRFSCLVRIQAMHQVAGTDHTHLSAANEISVEDSRADQIEFSKVSELVGVFGSTFFREGMPPATDAETLAILGKVRVAARRFIPSKHI